VGEAPAVARRRRWARRRPQSPGRSRFDTPAAGTKPAAKKPDRQFLPHAKDAIPIARQRRDVRAAAACETRRIASRSASTAASAGASRCGRRCRRIAGIGATRQRLLLRHFGSLKRVREAPASELAAIPGMTRSAAEAVVAHFAGQPLPASRQTARNSA
jgi:hypothetical protein